MRRTLHKVRVQTCFRIMKACDSEVSYIIMDVLNIS